MKNLPLVCYPTSIVWVDDDELFLKSAVNLLKTKYSMVTLNNAKECEDYMNEYSSPVESISFLRGAVELEDYDIPGHMPVDLNMEEIDKLRNTQAKNSEISVLAVDYNMPGKNGIDLCRALKHLPMKKVLITGSEAYHDAIDAFNEGLIDCFIKKESAQLPKDIRFQMSRLAREYLGERTQNLANHLETDYKLPISDLEFVSFFKEWCDSHDIKEYYIIDKSANFLVINHRGEEFYFVTHTERSLQAFEDLYADDPSAALFVRAVKLRQKIPFFGQAKESWQSTIQEWTDCFYTPQVLKGKETYYWVAISNSEQKTPLRIVDNSTELA